jgi:hypothetical protein
LHFLRVELPGILAKRTDVLSPRMLRVIEDLAADWRYRAAHLEIVRQKDRRRNRRTKAEEP